MDNKDKIVKRSLRFSIFDGVFASIMTGFTQDYIIPFLLLLGGTARHVGIVSAFPNLFASILQLKSADITEKLKSRKKIINTFVFFQFLVLLPMAIIAFLGKANPFIFIFLVVLFVSFGAFVIPPWSSLMSDLVTREKRGEFFGWRTQILGFIIVASTFTAGFVIHLMEKNNIFYGFAIIFGSAFIFRIASWFFLTKMHEPYLEHKKEDYFSFFMFISKIRESNFAKFTLFVSLMSFSVNLSAPFFAVFMIKDLYFNYLTYTMVIIAAGLTVYGSMGRWGKHADKIGNIKIIKFTSVFISIIPLLWIIDYNPAYLFLIQMFSGFVWSGFNLCVSNFIYDAVTPGKRMRCIAYFNFINGLSICCGALLGGFLVPKLPPVFNYRILTLFLISSVLRIIVVLWLPAVLKEVRPVEKISNFRLFFSMLGVQSILKAADKAGKQ